MKEGVKGKKGMGKERNGAKKNGKKGCNLTQCLFTN
jgi:hypothetical protein